MAWYEYSCCGRTFIRWKRFADTPACCPRCSRSVQPFASCQLRESRREPSPE